MNVTMISMLLTTGVLRVQEFAGAVMAKLNFFLMPVVLSGGLGFFKDAVDGLKTVVTAIGAGLAVWGVINLLEGYSNDNPGAKSQGIKQLMAGGGIIIIAQTVIPQMTSLFS